MDSYHARETDQGWRLSGDITALAATPSGREAVGKVISGAAGLAALVTIGSQCLMLADSTAWLGAVWPVRLRVPRGESRRVRGARECSGRGIDPLIRGTPASCSAARQL